MMAHFQKYTPVSEGMSIATSLDWKKWLADGSQVP
jgi:hypothetical protein